MPTTGFARKAWWAQPALLTDTSYTGSWRNVDSDAELSCRAPGRIERVAMRRNRWVVLSVGIVALLLVGGAVGVYVLSRPIALDEPPLPVPNGYDDLFAAAQQIRGPVPYLETAPAEELRAFLAQNPDVLEKARVGLGRECRVPIVNSPAYAQAAVNRCQAMRRLALLFVVEGREAEIAGDPLQAAASYRDAVVLGSQIARGGLLIEAVAGYDCESLGLRELRRLLPGLPRKTCSELNAVLGEIETSREPWENIGRREQLLFYNTAPVRVRVSMSVSPTPLYSFDHWEWSRPRADALLRLARTHLALRMYWLDHAKYPDRLSELVPVYVAAVPIDPFGGNSLMYGAAQGGYELSSSGYNGENDRPIW